MLPEDEINFDERDFTPTSPKASPPYITFAEARTGDWHIIVQLSQLRTGPKILGEFFLDAGQYASRSTAIHVFKKLAFDKGYWTHHFLFVQNKFSPNYALNLAAHLRGEKPGLSSTAGYRPG